MALVASPAFAAKTHLYSGLSFGPDGTTATSFSSVQGVAVDQTSGDVYVYDVGEGGKVYKFDSGGTPSNFSALAGHAIEGVGGSGDGEEEIAIAPAGSPGGTAGDIYVANNLVVKIYSPSGVPLGELTGGETCGVATSPSGRVFVGVYPGTVREYTPTANPVSNADQSGVSTASLSGICNVAADGLGNVYAANYSGFSGTVKLEGLTAASATPLDPGANTLAVDPSNNDVYADRRSSVAQYDSSGALVGTFGADRLVQSHGLAVNGGTEEIYVGNGDTKKIEVFGAQVVIPGVVTGDVSNIDKESATIKGSVDPDGVEVESCSFEYGETEAYGQTAPCVETPAEIGVGEAFKEVHADLTGLSIGINYHYRLVASNLNGTTRGGDRTFKTLSRPTIVSQSTLNAVFTEAALRAQIDPEGFATTYRIEYGPDITYGQSTAERSVGSDSTTHTVDATLDGLAPATTYHWRVVATNSIGSTVGPDRVFNTFSPSSSSSCPNEAFRTGPSANLPDCRAYEMVTPVDKNNTDIAPLININSDLAELNQSAVAGGKITYSTSQGFGDSQGTPYVSQYMATRGEDGWENHGITPPQGLGPVAIPARVELEFRFFSPDLCSSVLQHLNEPPLAPGALIGFVNLYQRSNCGVESYETINTSEPQAPPDLRYDVQGVSANGKCTVFQFYGQLTPDANSEASPSGATGGQVYESCGGQLHFISMLPDGTASKSGNSAGASAGGFELRYASVHHALSEDGSRVYWTDSDFLSEGNLYVRTNATQPQSEVVGGECTETAKACTVKVSSESAHFWTASPDGSHALYATADFTAERKLYEFDLASKSSTLIAGKFKGLLGASEDLSRIYLVSEEALGGPNAEGQSATAGKPNLYLHDDTGFVFIATLASPDAGGHTRSYPIAPEPYKHTSRVSLDGLHAAFMSSASLTGYDNTDASSGEADAEVFIYDAEAERLSCVSCNPSGARPEGRQLDDDINHFPGTWAAALLPGSETQLYGSRVLSESGRRFFFDSYDALLPRDTNGKGDVYEWQAPGSGSCSKESPAFRPSNDGCLSLISSGESPADSKFVDASADGTDAFFATGSSLLPQDPGLVDIYDARAGGGYPPAPNPPAPCEGEACQSPPSPPNDPTPASSAFDGPGNVREESKHRCAKGKTRRKGRCINRKRGHAVKHKGRVKRDASNNRRNAR